MTPDELEVFRLKVRIVACELVLRAFYTALASTSPNAPQVMLGKFQELRKKHSTLAMKGYPPEVSDLMAAEYQDALDDLLNRLESGNL